MTLHRAGWIAAVAALGMVLGTGSKAYAETSIEPGFRAGFNLAQDAIDESDLDGKFRTGARFGATAESTLDQRLGIETALIFNMKGGKFESSAGNFQGE